jgi:hypothetical protein
VEGLVEDTAEDTPLVIAIKHRGDERFCHWDGSHFPEDGVTEHGEVNMAFGYSPKHYAWDSKMRMAKDAIHHSGIPDYGNLTQPSGFDDVDPSYTGVGPFATWELSLSEEENSGFDFTKAKRIVIDFHGVCQHFVR